MRNIASEAAARLEQDPGTVLHETPRNNQDGSSGTPAEAGESEGVERGPDGRRSGAVDLESF